MNDQNPVIHNPKAKTAKPQGQLASLMQSRWGDDFGPAGEISRSSSAPPTQLLMQNNNLDDFGTPDANGGFFQKVSNPGSAFTSPSQPNWGLWGAPSMSPGRNGEPPAQASNIFAPTAVSSATRTQPAWNAPSPLRSGAPLDAASASPLRRVFEPATDFQPMAPGLIRPKSVNPSYRDTLDSTNDDEIRMKALLNAALDSREDLFEGPIPRAASTPPSRIQFQNPKFQNNKEHQQDIAYAMQNMALNNEEYQTSASRAHQQPGTRRDGPHTTINSHFPEPSNVTFSRDYEMYQLRQRAGDVFAQEASYLTRPASAQGRFSSSPASRYATAAAPPGFDNSDTNIPGLDPAMAQALATLSAAGNLSQAQIQQIQMSLRYGSPGPNNSAGDMSKNMGMKNQPRTGPSPNRNIKNGRDQSPTSNGGSSPVRSALLEEFRSNKNRKYDLRDIVGHIVEFSGDQHGSRFIQQKLESATDDERQLVFEEIFPHAIELTTDVFGNYVIQKFFEHGSSEQKETLAVNMEGQILNLSLQMYGCRVVQKAFEYVSAEQQAKLIKELEGNVLKCVKDQNGNHVIQKAIERVSPDNIRFIIDAFYGQVYVLATHPYGCRVIQRIFEHCSEKEIEPLLGELHKYAMSLIQDQYGNYVIQHILEKGKPNDKAFVIGKVKGNVLTMSKHKFASNVVEKCVSFGSAADRQEILDEVVTTKSDGTTPLYTMMKDQFANYVVQKLLDVASEPQRILLVTKIKPQLPSLKKYTYGKHLINKVEKFITQYRID